MIKFAITGGIGSGKSYVSQLLEARGIPVYNADAESKRLTVACEDIRKDLIALLGEDVYQDGTLNKQLLASYLFASADNAARINAIIHPRVKSDFRDWAERHADEPLVGLESAILYESGFDDVVDSVWMVHAPEELRIERAMKRDRATEEQIRARMAAQMDDDEKCRRAHFVIRNDGSRDLDPQLDEIIVRLLKKG